MKFLTQLDKKLMENQIGSLLGNIRKEIGLTRKSLSEISEVSVKAIYQIETGRRRGRIETLVKIKHALKDDFGIDLFNKAGIKIVWDLKDLDKDGLDIIEGNLLGDGCISTRIKSEKGFYCQEAKDRAYLEWLGRELSKKGIISRVRSVIHHSSYSKERKQYYALYTHSCPAFFELHKKWYVKEGERNIKRIPLNIKLNARKVLHWYLGDGDLKRDKREEKGGRPCIRISTNSFTRNEIVLLIKRLKEDLGLRFYFSCMHRREERDYVIYLFVNDVLRFFRVIGEKPPEKIKNCITKVLRSKKKIYRFLDKWPNENDLVKILPKTKNIGKVLRERRKVLNLTQRELAKIVGVKAHHISEVENGRKYISLKCFSKFLVALNLDVGMINERLFI